MNDDGIRFSSNTPSLLSSEYSYSRRHKKVRVSVPLNGCSTGAHFHKIVIKMFSFSSFGLFFALPFHLVLLFPFPASGSPLLLRWHMHFSCHSFFRAEIVAATLFGLPLCSLVLSWVLLYTDAYRPSWFQDCPRCGQPPGCTRNRTVSVICL